MRLRRIAIVALHFALISAWPVLAGVECRRVAIVDPPVSIVAAVWSVDLQSIVLVNNGTRTLDVYGLDGRRRLRVSSPGSGDLDFNVPLGLQRTDSGYILNDENQHLLWLDTNFRALRSLDFRRGTSDDSVGEIWLDKQSDIRGDEAIGLLTRSHRGATEYGFFRLRFASPLAEPESLDRIPMPPGRGPQAGPTWRFQAYSAVDRYLVRVADRVYWLRLSEDLHLELVEYRAGRTRPLTALPAAYARWPRTLPEHATFEDVPAVFEQLENGTMISSLVSDGRRLFLLGHRPGRAGAQWTLFAVDAAGDKIDYSRELPSHAPELVVLPGARETAVIEVGAAHLLERRPQSILLLDNRWLERPGQGMQSEVACGNGAER